ncbi:MAG: radical SAM protein [Patescibacteria group bacterium]
MKIALVDIFDKKEEIQSKYYSLGLGHLVSYLKKDIRRRLNINIINSNIEKEIILFKPDVVGLSCVSQNFNRAKQIAKFCHEKGIIVIIGKSHISALPCSLDKNMDIGVIGEGEETFSELIKLLLNNRLVKKELRNIKGIVYHDGQGLVTTEPRPLIENLDSIPFPDRDILRIKRGDSIYMFTSRGCPYQCRFCFSSRFWNTVRFFSAEYVVSEIKYLVSKYSPLRITFCDDLFIADKERLKKIVSLMKAQSFYKKIKFTISVRANLINDETAKLIKEMGVDIVTMGLESGNNRVLNFLKGSTVTVQTGQEAITILKKYKLQVSASFIIGSPDETKEEIIDTYNFIRRSRLDLFEAGVLVPLPGTPIWDYALRKGFVSNDMDWDKLNINFLDNYNKYVILSEKLSREELKGLYCLFQKERRRRHFILRIKYIYRRPKEILYYLRRKIMENYAFLLNSVNNKK